MNEKTPKSIYSLFLICFLLIVIASCLGSKGSGKAQKSGLPSVGAEVGNLAPEFSFQDASGKWFSLSDFRGKKVFIFSWSSWCRCKYQLPDLEKFYRKHKSEKFEIIAIAADSMGFKWAQPYLDKADATFLALVDPNNELGRKYNFWATENGFFIDEAGVIRMRTIGFYITEPEHLAEVGRLINTDFKVGEQSTKKQSLAERIKAAETAIAANPKDISKRLDLAELYRKQGTLKKAEGVLREAIERKSLSAEAHYRLSVVLYQQGKVEEAVSQWKKAYRRNPTNYVYMRNIQAYKKPRKFYSELMKKK